VVDLWPLSGPEWVFVLLGVVAVASGLFAVTTRNLVHAALSLVVTLGAVAGCFLLLTAEFVAWVQVLIYVGAVVVLLVFGLMLTRAPIGESPDADSESRWPPLVVAVSAGAAVIVLLLDAFGRATIDLNAAEVGTAEVAGAAVFRTWVLPFEVLSVLLLAALVGAIALSKSGGEE
jgi:NADH-quinone oxidoreductase subunit J